MNGIAAYQENVVVTQSRGRLVVLLYEGAIKFLRQAIVELEAGRFMEKGQYINKAVAVIQELNLTLNMEAGGEVAQNLRSLYLFMVSHLFQANINRDAGMIRKTIAMLEDLLSAWKGIAE